MVYAATMLSTTAVLAYSIFNLYSVLCAQGLLITEKEFAFWDPRDPDVGICYNILWFSNVEVNSVGNFTAFNMTFDMSNLIPVVVFVLLDKPHDCFECFGKDPSRVYSIF